ncbi:MMPL family transporter [Jatrophihabitans sp.]|uniref:MMPL family transporter n=1 Tax=Jatrophihabitans sp. TaxID=1932789 RepID=UPI0030C70F07|nr:putative integral rane export protein [Jatrophihabitans sp.]
MRTIARFSIQRRWLVIALWIVFIVGAQLISSAAGGAEYKQTFTLPHTQSQTVLDLLKQANQQGQTGQSGFIVVDAKTGKLSETDAPAGLQAALEAECGTSHHVDNVGSPWFAFNCKDGKAVPVAAAGGAAKATGHNPLLATDDSVAIVNIQWQGNQNDANNFIGVHDDIKKQDSSTIDYEFTGGAFANLAAQQKGFPPELLGFIVALFILAFVFKALWPTLLPLVSAAAALGGGTALIGLLSHAMNVADFTTQLSQLMVIGVGVDYALFIVTRHRRNLLRGMSVSDSIVTAIDTSGRAVLFAGITVCIAILGLCALGVSFMYGVAIGTAISVALTMVASLTLLPALLSFIGVKALPRRLRASVLDGSHVESLTPTRWARWAETVQKRKVTFGIAAALIIAVLAIPFFSLRLGQADQSTDPAGSTTRKGYDLITSAPGFGKGYNSILELVISGPSANSTDYLKSITTDLGKVGNVNPDSIRTAPLNKNLVLINFKSISSPQDTATTSLVKTLRGKFSSLHEQGTSNKIYVFGQTAIIVDFTHVLASKMPLFFVAVIGLSFLLLMVAFRSLVVPLTAAIMNIFAAGASFGIVVAIFQWGWFSDSLGAGAGGPIDAFLPVLFFAILFGLSMDYQVFLVSRMHEEWVHSKDNHRAIRVGQTETGGIISAAAVIMIAVFCGFLLGDSRIVKVIGIGLGGAIAIDAFILRTVLVPALMHGLGNSNWFFPKWLDRATPHLSVEPADDDEPEKDLVTV